MLLGILSDPHANLPALEAVLADVEGVRPDVLICLGDFVGYGAQPNEVVEALRDRCAVALVGNHDLAALGSVDISDFNRHAAMAALWTRDQLTHRTRSFLEGLEPRGVIEGLELDHASPRDPVWEYVLDTSIADANFSARDFEVALVGHTHVPAVFWRKENRTMGFAPNSEEGIDLPDGRLILNPGAIGQPRDEDPRASWATWDPRDRRFTVRRIEYPIALAQRAIRAAGLPGALADRLAQGW